MVILLYLYENMLAMAKVSTQKPFYIFFTKIYDDRAEQTTPIIRVVALSKHRDVMGKAITCLLWYEDMLQPESVNTLTHIDLSGEVFASYILSCTPRYKTGSSPYYVSIVTGSTVLSTTLLPVETILKPQTKQGFGVCVKVSCGDIVPVKIVEWMELYRSWGVSGVTIYNNSLSQTTLDALQYYIDMEFVDLRQAPDCVNYDGEKTSMLNEAPTMNDYMYTNMHKYQKIIIMDFDELIVPKQHRTYEEMLSYKDGTLRDFHPHQTYHFHNAYFFLDFPPQIPPVNQNLARPSFMRVRPRANYTVLRHVRRL